jgi:hypothetical protein
MTARAPAVALAALLAFAAPALAKPKPEPALPPGVSTLVDEARGRGLPTAPLEATALEGVAHGATTDRILLAVRAQVDALARARDALAPRAAEAEIVAGASVIAAGVPADSLARLRAAGGGSVLVPLVVMADLIARGVTAPDAAGTLIAALRARLGDPELMRLRERVADDIRAGAPPAVAVTLRMRALMQNGGAQDRSSSWPRAPDGAAGGRSP